MVLMGMDLPLEAVQAQIGAGIDILVHLGRLRDRSRKVLDIMEVVGYENHQICIRPLYQFRELEGNSEKESKGEVGWIRGCWEKKAELENRDKLRAAGL